MPVKGGYLLAAGGGIVLLYAGFKGKNAPQVLRKLISGQDPQATLTAYPIESSPEAFTTQDNLGVAAHGTTGAIGSQIAEDARAGIGGAYVWGGAPGNGKGHWDCSSFANAVIGRDMGLAIPLYKAGTYHGQSHGPNTVVWLAWTGAFTIKRADAAPGDLAIWQTHMGIIVDNNHMVSAQDVQLGTRLTTISGGAPAFEKLFVRRLKAVTPGGGHRG
jgi:cell wall-associated NlpC family hydrolase